MPLVPFGDYRPDVSDYEGSTTKNIRNVLPRGDGYGPFPDFAVLSQSLPSACRGGFYALNSDGSVTVFAGTVNALYRANNTDYSWAPVGKLANCTISNASPGVVTYSNTFAANDPVVFAAGGGTLPSQIVAGTVYYVHATGLSGSSFSVSATPGGTRINTSGGSGTVQITSHYSDLASDAQWQFAQFGNLVKATQKNVVLQTYTLGSSSAFADNAGSPPQASYISVVGQFLVLSGLLSNPFRIAWCDLNDTTNWSTGLADSQDFPDGGIVRGVAGGEFGIVFQDQAIRRMSFIPGSDLVFQIERIAEQLGLFAPYSIVRAGDKVFFHSAKGFYKIEPGGVPVQIGREKVNRSFFNELDKTELRMFIGAADPRSSVAPWAYKSPTGTPGLFDKLIRSDDALDRFFPITTSGEYLLSLSQPGITLENLDSLSSSLDALAASLDSFAVSTQPLIGGVNSSHQMGFFSGSNLEATLETAEQGADGERLMFTGFEVISDAPTIYGSLSYRETPRDSATSMAEILVNSRTGNIDARRSTRYARMKLRIPAGTSWTYAAGIKPVLSEDGET